MSRSKASSDPHCAAGTRRPASRLPRLWMAVVTLALACGMVRCATVAVADDAASPSIAHMDELWARREVPDRVREMLDVGTDTLARDPQSYEAAWRVARAYWYLGHTTTERERARNAAEDGMRYAERAVTLRPDRVEGHFMYALAVANYGLTLSPFVAATKGIAAKFEAEALKAYELDPTFDRGGPIVALGRYYYELPWPLRDLDRSRRYLEEARRLYPGSLYAREYLAETVYALGDGELAEQELISVVEAQCRPDSDRDPEASEASNLARQAIERWFPSAIQMAAVGAGDARADGTCRF